MSISVKTAISIEKGLFNEVNILADEMHVSRSKIFVMAVKDFIKKNENKNLLAQINDAFDEAHNIKSPDSEEIRVHNIMRKKQAKNLGAESW